jgi:hypothetical protein
MSWPPPAIRGSLSVGAGILNCAVGRISNVVNLEQTRGAISLTIAASSGGGTRQGSVTLSVFPLLKNAAFPPEVIHAMVEAFDRACLVLDDGPLPPGLKETIANRVIEVALSGERDPEQYLRAALRGMSI